MKIVFLLQDTRSLYGAEKATVRLAEGLVRAGVGVHVLLLEETRLAGADGAAAPESPLAAALWRVAPVTGIPVRGRLSRGAVRDIRTAMAELKGDVLHSTGYKADVHAAWAGRGGAFPVVGTAHGWLFRWQWKERLFQWMDLRAMRQFSRVIVLSEFYEGYLRRKGLHPLQLARIPTGVTADSVVGRSEADALWAGRGEVFTFGMLGRLSQEKNHALLFRAAKRLDRMLGSSPRPWRILVAGDGPLKERLARQLERGGLADRVELAGRMAPAEFFRRTHALVQCSRVENQPLSVLEAMAWERPVIATRVGGLPELVEEGVTGWLVRAGRAGELAEAMKRCLVSPERAREAGYRGRERLEREYREETMIRRHIGLYEAEIGVKA